MTLGLHIPDRAPPVREVDLGDGGPPVLVHDMWPLDALAIRLADVRDPADIHQIESDLRRSTEARLRRRGGMAAGPAPYLRRALAMCQQRRNELAANAAQASGGASVAIGKKG